MDIEITLQKDHLSYFEVMRVLDTMPQFEFSITKYIVDGEEGTFVIHSEVELPEVAVSYPLLDQFYKSNFEAILYKASNFAETAALNKNMVNLALSGYSQYSEKNKIMDLAAKVLLGSKIDVPAGLEQDWCILRERLYQHIDKKMLDSLEEGE